MDPPKQRSRMMIARRWLVRVAILVVLASFGLAGSRYWDRYGPQTATAIFAGITYGCERLERTAEGGGLVYWARVDLTAPGIGLYVTPLDAAAMAKGWQYRLRRIADVVDSEHLAIAINASGIAS